MSAWSDDTIAWICVSLVALAPLALLVLYVIWRASAGIRAAEREAQEVDRAVRELLAAHRREDDERRRRP